ncbi:MAG TPA: glycogen debranching N-terminal domain-containing protein [Gemmatimonadales bacterium]|nr:glycogen debranching N-terminal domain-containing protein [Gemmatimonadales bacterium]
MVNQQATDQATGDKAAKPKAADHEAADRKAADQSSRKWQVLTRGPESVARTIADAVVIKSGDIFLLTDPDGRVPRGQEHGLGLYYHDCRFLRSYDLRLAGTAPVGLGSTAVAGNKAVFQLTNPDLRLAGGYALRRDVIGIKWVRELSDQTLVLAEHLTFQNWSEDAVSVPVEFRFDAEFQDVFEVRGLIDQHPGTLHPPEWHGETLQFAYDGRDGIRRTLSVSVPGELAATGDHSCAGTIRLDPRGHRTLALRFEVKESPEHGAPVDPAAVQVMPTRSAPSAPPESRATVHSDSVLFNALLDRSFTDLDLLRTEEDGCTFFAAGVPWFAALFGRDSLISALQVLPYQSRIAAETLRLLARHQGTKIDDYRAEQPGKILHELRVGELARTGDIPHNPYYGSIDSTPLFLIVLARYVAWTGDLSLFSDLHDNVERALTWIAKYGDTDGDGFVDYPSTDRSAESKDGGIINQGWKDSGNAIIDEQGHIATPPIALVEVQGYVYAAKLGMADLFERAGDKTGANTLRKEASELRTRFNRAFWLPDLGFYAMALEAGDKPLRVISSNPGHALWTGIADGDKAESTAKHLMADDMFSGFGIRTLSCEAAGYTPIGYHLGTVWPHDTGFCAAGLHRYGFGDFARKVLEGIVAAASDFEHERLPELFTGFSRKEYGTPIRYPVACHPQAWAAGSVPFLLYHLLGLEPDAFSRHLRVVRPLLPEYVDTIELRGLRVGNCSADLRFERTKDRDVAVRPLSVKGGLEVTVELDPKGKD